MSDFKITKVNKAVIDDDISRFVYAGVEAKYINNMRSAMNNLKILLSDGEAWVGRQGEVIVGFGGFFPLDERVYEGWVVLNPTARRNIKRIIKFSYERIRDALTSYADRIQVRCFTTEDKAVKLIRILGFVCEGMLRKALQGRDAYIFSLIKEDLVCP